MITKITNSAFKILIAPFFKKIWDKINTGNNKRPMAKPLQKSLVNLNITANSILDVDDFSMTNSNTLMSQNVFINPMVKHTYL
jgi:hypothetical protein